ncbi:unnamed protein product [Pedinophyceae sp. YPF-701]|nr:unnamed protein product [Pedinophyceae sp. YPF-701]
MLGSILSPRSPCCSSAPCVPIPIRTPSRTACGCLGLCGNGPNAVLELHGQKPVKLSHITTTTGLARVLEQFCDVRVDERTLKASQLRSAGNAEARRGNAKRAVNFYRDALAADPPQGRHLILSNLSVVLLTVKDLDSALEAAREAQACAPPGWPRGYMREADVLCAMGRKDEAAAALEGARRADRGAHRSLEYQAIARQLGLDKRAR